jgi:DNA-binding MarR family transcriptional regulator
MHVSTDELDDRHDAEAPPAASGSAALWARPGYLVRRLHQIAVAIFLEEMSELDLTPVQFGAMTIIASRPGIEQSVLGEELGIDRVNAGDVVLRLMKNGHARREVSARDRRYKEVYLTEGGHAILAKGGERMKRVQTRLLCSLDPAQRETFMELLIKLIESNNDRGRATLRLPDRTA